MNGSGSAVVVSDAAGLIDALANAASCIEVTGVIGDLAPITLREGQVIRGAGLGAALVFTGAGLMLTADNRVSGLEIRCPPTADALAMADDAGRCGTLELHALACEGCVRLIFGDAAGDVVLTIDGLAIQRADASGHLPRPFGNGVEVQQGALTVWNRSAIPSLLTLDAAGIVAGTPDAPVRGTGIFIAGDEARTGGTVSLRRFETGPVHSDSALPKGTTRTVSGGLFFLAGTSGRNVVTQGDIVTHGANAVPVDNWGDLESWTIMGDARSFGPSAVGFVNAGTLGRCSIDGSIETHGDGARGCCIYGPTGTIAARAIRTHGKAASGVQVVDTLDRLILSEGIVTSGDAGEGLMKGQMISTPAHGVEVEAGGHLGELDCTAITVSGSQALPVHAANGAIGRITRRTRTDLA